MSLKFRFRYFGYFLKMSIKLLNLTYQVFTLVLMLTFVAERFNLKEAQFYQAKSNPCTCLSVSVRYLSLSLRF